jgi:hypothetical protein
MREQHAPRNVRQRARRAAAMRRARRRHALRDSVRTMSRDADFPICLHTTISSLSSSFLVIYAADIIIFISPLFAIFEFAAVAISRFSPPPSYAIFHYFSLADFAFHHVRMRADDAARARRLFSLR